MYTRNTHEIVGKPPRSYAIVFIVGLTNFAVSWVATAFRQFWASQTPAGPFTYPIRFKGSHVWYFPRLLGQYVEGAFYAHFVFLAIVGGIMYLHRDQLVRVGPPSSAIDRPEFSTTLFVAARALAVAVAAFFISSFASRVLAPDHALASVIAVCLFALALLVLSALSARRRGFGKTTVGELVAFHGVIAVAIMLFSFYFGIVAAGTA